MLERQLTRRQLVERGAAFAALASASPLLAACGGSGSSGSGKKFLTIAGQDTPVAIDPTVYSGEPMIEGVYNTYATLTRYKSTDVGSGVQGDNIKLPPEEAVEGWLAESWEQDGLRLRFKLREGVVSPYGNELTAEDVVWTFNRHTALDLVGKFGLGVAQFKSWNAVDKYTVECIQGRPSHSALLIAALPLTCGVYDSTEAKKHTTAKDAWAQEWLKLNTAGFGPFNLTETIPGSKFVYTAHKDYFEGAPKLERVEWLAVPSPSDRVALLEAGDVDIIEDIAPQLRSGLRNQDGITVQDIGADWAVFTVSLTPNFKRKPLGDVRVRQALAYLLPLDEIIDKVYQGEAVARKSWVAPSLFGATNEFWDYTPDLAKAKDLLAAAGVAEGFPTTITFDSTQPGHEQIAALLASAYGKAGIKVTLNKLSAAAYSDALFAKKNFDLILTYGGPLIPDAQYELFLWYQGDFFINTTGYKNPKYDELVAKAGEATDPDVYVKVVHQALKVLSEDIPRIGIVQTGDHYMYRDQVKGFFWRANTGHYDWYRLSL